MMEARSLRLVGGGVCAAIQAALGAAADGWAGDWGIERASLTFGLAGADHAPGLPPRWRHGWSSGAARIWFDWSGDCAAEIERLLFAPCAVLAPVASDGAALAPDTAGAALDALLDALAAAACGAGARQPMLPGQQPDVDLLPFSGALALTVGFGAGVLHCLLDAGLVSAWAARLAPSGAPRLPKLAVLALGDVLGPVALALPVRLGSVEVDLGSLMTVAVGDVIRLDVALDSPLDVLTPDGKLLFAAHLGRVGADMAIELAASRKQ